MRQKIVVDLIHECLLPDERAPSDPDDYMETTNALTLSYTGFFGLAGHGGDGIHYTFITLVLFDGFELNLVQ